MSTWISLQHHALLLLLLLSCSSCSPIMVPSGKVGPIVPPTPRPRKIVPFPVKEPRPVHEFPDPALDPPFLGGNSIVDEHIYERKRFGMQLRNPPPPPVGVFLPRTINAKMNRIAYQLSLKYPQYKLFL